MSTIRKTKNKIINFFGRAGRLFIIPFVVILALLFGALTVFAGYGYVNGTVDGTSWIGESYISWYQSGNGVVYSGASFTEAPIAIDQNYVSTRGCEICGIFTFDTDWEANNLQLNTSIVGQYGDGWAMPGECSWFIWDPTIDVENQGYHSVYEDGDSDSGNSYATDFLPY